MKLSCPPIIALVISLAAMGTSAHACPLIGGLADYNCDGNAEVVVLGDSIVYGTKDKKNHGKGGYVLRAQSRFPEARITNLGVPGLGTRELLNNIQDSFEGASHAELASSLRTADLVVLDIGRNDFWTFRPPTPTARNLKRIAANIKEYLSAEGVSPPLVVTSVLLLPNRGSQGPWVKDLNKLILKSDSPTTPADLRFDLVSKTLLCNDRLHPTSDGYDAMAKVFVKYLLKSYPLHSAARR